MAVRSRRRTSARGVSVTVGIQPKADIRDQPLSEEEWLAPTRIRSRIHGRWAVTHCATVDDEILSKIIEGVLRG